MAELAKETVIIVHGTYAAPDPAKRRWYEPVDRRPGGEPFPAKLDAALQERGSPARCWAHCTQGNQIFHWSGDNSWIARTHAASELGDYVAKLQNEGWRCHIVAHSHGGNVLVEALPQIISTPKITRLLGKIVTLGTPFMDTRSPILKSETIQTSRFRVFLLGIIFLLVILSAIFLTLGFLAGYDRLLIATGVSFIVPALMFAAGRWRILFPLAPRTDEATVGMQFLALSSEMDEAWQVLHFLPNVDNPLAVEEDMKSYLFSSLRSRMSRSADIERMLGAVPWRSSGLNQRLGAVFVLVLMLTGLIIVTLAFGWFAGFLCLLLLALILFSLLLQKDLPWGAFKGAGSAPFRWLLRLLDAFASAPVVILTYFIRLKSWPVLVAIAMGLEGYRYELPNIERQPDFKRLIITYEDMPKGAVQRALKQREAWISGHLGDVSETFSKLAVTTADIKSLLQAIEKDQTLVHAAYYTDDECIARIADWVADRA